MSRRGREGQPGAPLVDREVDARTAPTFVHLGAVGSGWAWSFTYDGSRNDLLPPEKRDAVERGVCAILAALSGTTTTQEAADALGQS